MIAAGVNAKELATYMGHASITITLDRYGHLFPTAHAGFLRRAADWYAERGITLERVLSDNAKAYHSRFTMAECASAPVGMRQSPPAT